MELHMPRVIVIGLLMAAGIASLACLCVRGFKIAWGSKSRLERDIDETLWKTRNKER